MTVEEGEGAITLDYNDKTYYFCSNGCRRAFEKDPEKKRGKIVSTIFPRFLCVPRTRH
jgi:YHS domain-containing protein